MDAYSVYVTVADESAAKKLAQNIVKERLAACANMLGSVESIYWWEGSLCEENEFAVLFKTSEVVRQKLIKRIKELHSYETPCITCHRIEDGNPDFLNWIHAETSN